MKKPYLVLVSIDGFGWDARARADTPALDRLADTGVVAESMRPVFPTLTFPNHYAIATGLYPAEHGIVGNRFPNWERDGWYMLSDREAVQDGSWYSGEPIWVRAEKSGMVAASYFFVGTEAYVGGIRPTYSYLFDADVPGEARVDQVIEWLHLPDEKRPHMLTLYFEDVDDASHAHGPDAPETVAVISKVDGFIGRLLDGIDSLPFADDVYVIVVSDHGQARYSDPENALILDEHVDIGDAGVIQGGNYVKLYYDSPDPEFIAELCESINAVWEHGTAYPRSKTPAHWRVADDPRYPDVIIQPDDGHAVVTSRDRLGWLSTGAHGWPPSAPPMQATFIANGPGLPEGKRIGPIKAVDVYPFMLEILDLEAQAGYVPSESALTGLLDQVQTAD
ncbi:MAG: ectonucleotide pyrophosphatase/phosphodiesterase [Woeseiaceae bacterium]|nr:ectonucleotide pyrophosphatase/phosphodiesterase [Woeseiaceae bacterium]